MRKAIQCGKNKRSQGWRRGKWMWIKYVSFYFIFFSSLVLLFFIFSFLNINTAASEMMINTESKTLSDAYSRILTDVYYHGKDIQPDVNSLLAKDQPKKYFLNRSAFRELVDYSIIIHEPLERASAYTRLNKPDWIYQRKKAEKKERQTTSENLCWFLKSQGKLILVFKN